MGKEINRYYTKGDNLNGQKAFEMVFNFIRKKQIKTTM